MLYPQYFIDDLKTHAKVALIITAFILLIILVGDGIAQEKPKAILVDEFSQLTCDDILARAENFFMQLHANPSARGYFMISGRNDLLRGKLFWERQFYAIAAARSLDRERLVEIRGSETGDFKGQFWLVPSDVIVPDFRPSTWNFSLSAGAKAFIINSEFGEMCEDPINPSMINDFLNANPGMRVHAVIYANTKKARQEGLRNSQGALKTIPANRVRYFIARSHGYSIPLAEYWLVPKKR